MFYTQVLMSKRGPLAKIWLAAHWEKKLTKAHVFECNLEITIEKIISPKVKIALRTSGHLLLGVVRIYNRKAKYLLADCNEAFLKMKMTFRPGLVDLPKENFEAAYNMITLPEEFHDFETHNINGTEVSEHFNLNQSKPEDITLQEDYSNDLLYQAGSFGEESEILRRHSFFDDNILLYSSGPLVEHSSETIIGGKTLFCEGRDGFGDEGTAVEMIDNLLQDKNIFSEDMDLNEEIPLPRELLQTTIEPDPENICLHINEEMNGITQSNEEEGFSLEPIDISDIAGKRKSKKRKLLIDPVKEISSKIMHKQLTSFADTLMVLELAPPTERLMMQTKKGGVETLLSTAAQDLTHAKLKKLFTNCFLSCDFKLARKFKRNESVMNEMENKNLKVKSERYFDESSYNSETSIAEKPSFQKESSQTKAWKEVINGSKCSFYEDTSRNINSEPDIVEMICSSAVVSNSTSTQESENHLIEQKPSKQEPMEIEQNTEDKWNRRTLHMLNKLRESHRMGNEYFSLMMFCRNSNRKQTAVKFYSFLVLKKQKAIELKQNAPYEDIIATRGPMFYEM